MTNTILIKRSGAANAVPASGNLSFGELAINYADGNLFFKNVGGTVQTIASTQFVSVTGNITGGNVNAGSGIITTSGNITGGNVLFGSGTVSGTGNIAAGNIITVGSISASGNVTGNYFIGNGSQLTGLSNAFSIITATGESNVVANNTGVVNFVSGVGISILTDPANAIITFGTIATDSIFATGGDMGSITVVATVSEDLGLITDLATISYDLGTLVIDGLIWPSQFKLPSYVVAGLPSPSIIGLMAFATDAVGGSIPVFSDGTNWRRVDDRSIVT